MVGRHFKQGLDYFPLSVDFFCDDRMQLIGAEFGSKGLMVAMQLLCKVYQNGYYYPWGDDERLLFAQNTNSGLSTLEVQNIVNTLIRRQLFDGACYAEHVILASRHIQQVYLEVARRRKWVEVVSDYWIIESIPGSNVQIREKEKDANTLDVHINQTDANIFEQRKVKKKESTPSVVDSTCTNRDSCTPAEVLPLKKEFVVGSNITTALPSSEALVKKLNDSTKGVFGEVRLPLNTKRRQLLRARLREFGLPAFGEMLGQATISNFLKGDNKSSFKASLDWMIRTGNFQKIVEGNYANHQSAPQAELPGQKKTFLLATERMRAELEYLKGQITARYGQDFGFEQTEAQFMGFLNNKTDTQAIQQPSNNWQASDTAPEVGQYKPATTNQALQVQTRDAPKTKTRDETATCFSPLLPYNSLMQP